jgi:hypothetical protein
VFPDRQERPEKKETIILSAQKKFRHGIQAFSFLAMNKGILGEETNFSRKQIKALA